MYYYQARHYDPLLGRFVQPDTIVPEPGDPQSLNRYSYGKNSPQRYVDPDGHNPFDILIGILYGLVFTAGYSAEAGNQVRAYAARNDLNAEQLWVMYRYAGTPAEQVGIDHEVCLDAGFNTANTLVAAPAVALAALRAAGQVYSRPELEVPAVAKAEQIRIDFLQDSPNRVAHIMQQKHAWDRIVTLSGDIARDYQAIQPFIRDTMSTEGALLRHNDLGQTVYQFTKVFNGQEIVVKALEIAQKTYQITDAWVKTR